MPRAFISVPDMHCSGCSESVKKAVLALDPRAHLVIDLNARTIQVDSAASETQLLASLRGAQWDAKLAAHDH